MALADRFEEQLFDEIDINQPNNKSCQDQKDFSNNWEAPAIANQKLDYYYFKYGDPSSMKLAPSRTKKDADGNTKNLCSWPRISEKDLYNLKQQFQAKLALIDKYCPAV